MARHTRRGKGGGGAGGPPAGEGTEYVARIKEQRGRVVKAEEAEAMAHAAWRRAKEASRIERGGLYDLIDGVNGRPLIDAIEAAGARKAREAAEAPPADDETWRESLRPDAPGEAAAAAAAAAGPPEDDTTWRRTPLADLALTKRIVHALEAQGFTALGPLVDATAAGLKLDDIRGISRSAAQIIAEAIAEFWRTLRGEPGDGNEDEG